MMPIKRNGLLLLVAAAIVLLAPAAPSIARDDWGRDRTGDRPAQRKPAASPTARDAAPPPAAQRASPRDAAAAAGMPLPPEGAQWTIYCQTVSGPEHVNRANRYKEALVQATPDLRDWYVIHQDGQSTLYYGFYRSFDDAKDAETQRAQRDRRTIDSLTDRMGNRPFKFAFFVALDSPDPVAPPEWNLTNANGAYSLQIAAYTGHPLRKQAAVDAVRAARAQGIEAFYYHGENTSSVCVGAWPENAVSRTQEVVNARAGDPDQPFIATGIPLPEEAARNQRDAQGRPIRVEQERFEIVDASLARAMRTFPEHAVNGEVTVTATTDASGRRISRPASSFVVPIPKPAPSLLSDPTYDAAPGSFEDPAPSPLQPPAQQPGTGTLRGVGP